MAETGDAQLVAHFNERGRDFVDGRLVDFNGIAPQALGEQSRQHLNDGLRGKSSSRLPAHAVGNKV
jgi:hypothetical protein